MMITGRAQILAANGAKVVTMSLLFVVKLSSMIWSFSGSLEKEILERAT
jgi:hypothetical protein